MTSENVSPEDDAGNRGKASLELTLLRKAGGLLSKRITLGEGGRPRSDGSGCRLARGEARRHRLNGSELADALATVLNGMDSDTALALGRMRDGIGDTVIVASKARQTDPAATITRSLENFVWANGPGWVLLDFDAKGMPDKVRGSFDKPGSFEDALRHLIPGYDAAAHVVRASTSSGLSHSETGKEFPGSGGMHVYVLLKEQADAPRFLKALHQRAWLVGAGWLMVGTVGQLLERSIVDVSVASPERLVFEGAPVVEPPLVQDVSKRRAVPSSATAPLDSRVAVPDLDADGLAKFSQLVAAERARLRPEAKAEQKRWLAREGAKLGPDGERILKAALAKKALTGPFTLHFDDEELGAVTVDDVMLDPARFDGETLADPLDGPDYGVSKGKLFVNHDGGVVVNSFAHGGRTFRLLHSEASARAVLERAGEDAAKVYVRVFLAADLNAAEQDRLIDLVHKLTKIGKLALKADLKKARAEAREERERERPEEADDGAREKIRLGPSWVNETTRRCAEVLSDELYMRGAFPAVLVRVEELGRGREAEDAEPEAGVVLGEVRHARGSLLFAEPTPERLMYRLDERLIFQKFDARTEKWATTSCPTAIARRVIAAASDIGVRPCAGIVTVPLFVDGQVIVRSGYHPGLGVYFDVPDGLSAIPERPTKDDASRALAVLLTPFRSYVAADEDQLRCACAAAALTAVLRPSLDRAPAVLIDAEVPGAGKGKLARALSVIATGRLPSIVTEGHGEEEIEKRLASAIMAGSSAILLDNLQRTLASSTLESGLTEGFATIRIFGKLADVTVPCSAFVAITANNATLRADMLRRVLPVRIVAGTDKPETKVFGFDPYEEAVRRRAEIVVAGLTVAKAWWSARDTKDGQRIRDKTLGSFERWADLVAGAVEWLVGVNPIALIEARKADDPARNAEWNVISALRELFGDREWTAKEAVGEPAKTDNRDGYLFREATGLDPDIWAGAILMKGPRPTPLHVGQWLNRRKDRVWKSFQLVNTIDRKGIARWRIIDLPGLPGSAGVVPPGDDKVREDSGNGKERQNTCAGGNTPGEPRQPRHPEYSDVL